MASWVALRAVTLDLDLEEREWVDALHTEGRALLDEGLGMFAYTYRLERGATIRLGAVAGQETAPEFWEALSAWGSENESALAQIYQTTTSSFEDAARSAARGNTALSDPRRWFEPHG